ncbi:amidohydrolase family protein [Frigidibacter sp. ROC022]|uniref:amidohydrolase family protein n=1 Tax=Frigidibacter sp. ROC022 TaxID=2971796 RepID=UPI00215B723E|nr:amidohydrolase family protein [Frigidibacter sp. ROC022]MCR8724559.1 amidohydrolase family protein [Frigidibacter sp. ROC022]
MSRGHAPAPGRTAAGATGTRLTGVAMPGRPGHFDLVAEDDRIVSLTPSTESRGGVVTPLFTDVHVHLDKTYTISRIGGAGQARVESLFDAIALMEQDRPRWTAADIRARANRALENAYRLGVGAMRTHVDWIAPEVPEAWPVLVALREEWKGRVELQIAALVRGDLVPSAAGDIAARVRQDGGVLGAFFYRDEGLAEKVETMFALARQHDLDLDFHVDEGLDPEANGFELIVAATARHGYRDRVLCGHACSLAVRTAEELDRILAAAAEAGVALVALPTSNLYLQDRGEGVSPRRRGIAPIKEARRAGIATMLGSDNVGDAFYPYGDYDPLSILRLAATACQIAPEDWIDSITSLPGRLCSGNLSGLLAEGGPADFIWHAAEDLGELISRPRAERIVYRGGRPLPANHFDWRNA